MKKNAKVLAILPILVLVLTFVVKTSSAQSYCPAGTVISSDGYSCVGTVDPGYGSGGYSDPGYGSQCYGYYDCGTYTNPGYGPQQPSYNPCPAGTVPSSDGYTCVSTVDPGYGPQQPSYNPCPAGTVPSSDGYTCVGINPPVNPYPPMQQCPPGTILNGGICVSTVVPNYPPVNPYPPVNYPPIVQQCPIGTVLGPDGWSCMLNIPQCPAGTTLSPDGYTCISNFIPNPIPTPPTFVCPGGLIVANPAQCPPTPVPPTFVCWNGIAVTNANQCPPQIQYQTCWNGSRIPTTQICPQQTQTCWNGQILPVTQACPTQYQTCWDGSMVPLTQSCPVKTTTTVIIKKVETILRDHSVVTDLASRITEKSAQCNGVGLINGNVNSIGWFEFGETRDLSSVTNSANIGSSKETLFSNLITGLQPNTRYYCRAVMSNKDGVYRGQIVSFKTLAKTKTPVTYPSPKKEKQSKYKTEFYCADGSVAEARTVLVGETINSGGKLLKVTIERSIPEFTIGASFNYRVTITNTADTDISGVETKIVLPSEISYADATTTGGITLEEGVMTIPVGSLKAGETKTMIFPVQISKDAELGKAIITTAYVGYNLPVKGEQIVRDEVSTYMVGNLVAGENNSNSSSAHSTLASLLFPQTLLGWLVLFAVILILVVLIRNLRKWYFERKKKKEETTIHHHIA